MPIGPPAASGPFNPERLKPKDLTVETERAADLVLQSFAVNRGKKTGYKRQRSEFDVHDPKDQLDGVYAPGFNQAKFDKEYRATWPGQDELVRTSFTRRVVARTEVKLSDAASRAIATEALKDLSVARFPTRWVGFNYDAASTAATTHAFGLTSFQHPTGDGLWQPGKKGFSGPHTLLDAARVTAVAKSVTALGQAGAVPKLNPGLGAEDVTREMLRAATTFSVQHMIAPALASNQDVPASITAAEKKAQTLLREYHKDRAVDAGAKRATKVKGLTIKIGDDLSRPFRPLELQDGEISPRRTLVPVTDQLAGKIYEEYGK